MEEGQNEAVLNSEQTPLFFGEYEAVRSIGKGKFAVVYRAHKIGDDENVALKRISVDMMNDKAREKCLKEVRLLQSLDHPNIIRYMDSFICNNDLIIVYEWAAAGDLKRQLRKAQERGVGFEERVIWKYFSQICNAMQHMHDKRIMHRDLKPANIFLTLEGVIKVGDLGLSRELSDNTFQAHSKVGTPLYMSPEVLKGDGYDFKSDIWSLGCLLYELAMLKSPFRSEGLNLYSLFQKISSGDYQPLSDVYSEELRNLTYAMMSTKPEDRPEIAYVCQVANKMRSQTANDKGNKKRPGSGTEQNQSNSFPEKPIGKPAELNTKESGNGNENLQKNVSSAISIERDDIIVGQVETDRKLLRKTSAERRSQNPFQRVPSNGNIVSVADVKGETTRRENEDETIKALEVGLTLGDYFLQQDKEQRAKVDPWKEAESKTLGSNENHDHVERLPSKQENNHNTQGLLQSTKVAPAQQDAELQSSNQMYRRVKPPKPSSTGQTTLNPPSSLAPTSRINTAEAVSSRPSSGIISSRPSTVDDSPLYQNPMNDTTNPKLKETLENASAAFALMDLTYGKLQLLGYPMVDSGLTHDRGGMGRLLPIHFAINVNAYQSIAGYHAGYQFSPFKRWVHVILWLCENKLACTNNHKLQKIVNSIDMETGNNMTIAKQLLQAVQVHEWCNLCSSLLFMRFPHRPLVRVMKRYLPLLHHLLRKDMGITLSSYLLILLIVP
jgi:NIMA (never in mitosis gene a)-related kinase